MYQRLRAILVFTVMFLAAGSARAEDEFECNPEGNTAEMAICADNDYKAEDAKLNKAYGKLAKRLQGMDDDMGNTAPDTAIARLKAAQRAWIAFRDAECPLDTVSNMGGSIEQMLIPACLANLTKARTAQLQDHLKALDEN